jgi:hypothetical protein
VFSLVRLRTTQMMYRKNLEKNHIQRNDDRLITTGKLTVLQMKILLMNSFPTVKLQLG